MYSFIIILNFCCLFSYQLTKTPARARRRFDAAIAIFLVFNQYFATRTKNRTKGWAWFPIVHANAKAFDINTLIITLATIFQNNSRTPYLWRCTSKRTMHVTIVTIFVRVSLYAFVRSSTASTVKAAWAHNRVCRTLHWTSALRWAILPLRILLSNEAPRLRLAPTLILFKPTQG